jgi:hypothetical protein
MDAPSPGAADGPTDERTSALPSVGARVLAFSAIIIAGICGGLIGYAFTDLQCEGNCTVPSGLSAIIGAVVAAGGVAVVVVLALRAMGEWHTIQQRDQKSAQP